MARSANAPSDEGAFSFVPGVSNEKVRSALRGYEFKVTKTLMREHREPTQWTGALLVSIHRDVFKKFFPVDAGRLRLGEANFGVRAGEAPGRLPDLIMQLAQAMRAHLEEVLSMPNDGTRLEKALFYAASDHAEMIRIHPFVDGNGRWARIATTAFLSDCSYPVGAIIQSAKKRAYIEAIDRCIDHHEPGDLASHLLDGYIDAMERRLNT